MTGSTGVVTNATFLCDADGNREKSTVGSVTTICIAGIYEYHATSTTTAATNYYDGGGCGAAATPAATVFSTS